jgi:succinate dehydrogenase / fumarate reductase flavoprotein subunit
MVYPPGVVGLLVTEAVRGEGGILRNAEGERFMERYDPKRMELSTRDVVSRAIYTEVREGRGTEHGGVLLDVTHLPAETVKRKLPSMYEQFMELAGVDITQAPMEIGPTCHYVMGGIEVDPDTQAATVPGLFAAGEVGSGLHGSNRLGGNSLSDLLVFGKRAGGGAAEYVDSLGGSRPKAAGADVDAAAQEALAPFDRPEGENPYAFQRELQETMNDLVGIIRRGHELEQALERLGEFRARAAKIGVEGRREFNPGWHIALDLRNQLVVAECIARSALQRTESRGGHTREDFPQMDHEWRRQRLVCRLEDDGSVSVTRQPHVPMREDLLALFEVDELRKYLTEAELAAYPTTAATPQQEGE